MYQPFRDLDLRREQILRVRLALRVEQQRQRAAAAETPMQQEVDREEIRQLEPFHLALAHIIEMPLHERRRQMLEHPGVDGFRPRDDADVGGVALVAGAREAEASRGRVRSVEVRFSGPSRPPKMDTTVCSLPSPLFPLP